MTTMNDCTCNCGPCRHLREETQFLSAGEVRIICCHSLKVFDAKCGSAAPGTFIEQYEYHGGGNQRWWLICRDPVKRLYEIKASYCELVLDVTEGSKSNCARLQLYPAHGGDNQRFVFEPTSTPAEYFIRAWHSDLVLDVDSSSCANCAMISQYHRHGGANQRFRVERLDGCRHPALVYR